MAKRTRDSAVPNGNSGGAIQTIGEEFVSDEPPRPSATAKDEAPGVGDYLARVPSDETTRKWRELTRAGLAGALTLLLATVLLVVVWASVFADYSAQDAKDLLGVVLAPLVGLVGAATGFYYGGQQ